MPLIFLPDGTLYEGPCIEAADGLRPAGGEAHVMYTNQTQEMAAYAYNANATPSLSPIPGPILRWRPNCLLIEAQLLSRDAGLVARLVIDEGQKHYSGVLLPRGALPDQHLTMDITAPYTMESFIVNDVGGSFTVTEQVLYCTSKTSKKHTESWVSHYSVNNHHFRINSFTDKHHAMLFHNHVPGETHCYEGQHNGNEAHGLGKLLILDSNGHAMLYCGTFAEGKMHGDMCVKTARMLINQRYIKDCPIGIKETWCLDSGMSQLYVKAEGRDYTVTFNSNNAVRSVPGEMRQIMW